MQVSAYGLIALAALPLALVRKATPVHIDIAASEVRFVAKGGVLLSDIPVASFTVQNNHAILLSDGCLQIEGTGAPCAHQHAQILRAINNSEMSVEAHKGSVQINRLVVSSGSRVRMRALDNTGDWLQVDVDAPDASASVAIAGDVDITCNQCWRDSSQQTTSKALFRPTNEQVATVSGAKNGLFLSLELKDRKLVDSDALPMSQLDFLTSIDGQPRSAVKSGSIVLDVQRDKPDKVEMRKGEALHLAPNDTYVLMDLSVEHGQLNLRMSGTASELSLGGGETRFDRVPTLLDWLVGSSSWANYMKVITVLGSAVLTLLTSLHLFAKEK